MISSSAKLRDSGADLWLYLKADDAEGAEHLKRGAEDELGELAEELSWTEARRRHHGLILDGRFYDGITSPMDPVTLVDAILQNRDGAALGSCWAFSQKVELDWASYGSLGKVARDDVIGRNEDGVIIPDHEVRSHIRHARAYDETRSNLKLLRQSLPYGESETGAGREQGIYFAAFGQDSGSVETILRRMTGGDSLLGYVRGVEGGYWYVPNAEELGIDEPMQLEDVEIDPYWQERSANGLMFYNSADYLHTMGTCAYGPGDPPTDRVLGLAADIFSRWRDNWYQLRDIPRIPHLREFLDPGEESLLQASVAVRKGLAIKNSLSRVHTNRDWPQRPDAWAYRADYFHIHPDDLLFGVMPELSLGRGKEVMPYLRDDEKMPAFLLALDESSAMGHIVPDHATVLERGIGALLADAESRRDRSADDGDDARRDFFQSVVYALEGVQEYCVSYALLAERTAETQEEGRPDRREDLLALASRARKLAADAPETFLEATQLVFTMHCCIHLAGNPVSIGRLDQLLAPFHDDGDTEAEQEILDALWVKLDEKAIHNRHHVTDHISYGTTAVAYAGGGIFPQGGGINQWVQQVTVGGYLPDAAETPTPGCNPVTLMCLKSSRRLPLNAPCLSLRVYPGMPDEVIEEAARALVSGGAHPILFHEERMVGGLHEFSGFPLEAARNFACDGCYEPMIAGATEFAFGTVVTLDALEMALNQGATYSLAGPVYLRGDKKGFRSPPPEEIGSFEELQEIFVEHLRWLTVQFFHGVLVNYGNVSRVCPSPLLSSIVDGCFESGRDLSDGGARYHLVAPMFVALATTIDSLYAIKKLVFDPGAAVTTLPGLLVCLKSDWGFDLQEPWQSTLAGPERRADAARRYRELRLRALDLPRFGTGDDEVDALGGWVVEQVCELTRGTLENPPGGLREVIDGIVERYSLEGRPFRFHTAPGIGTFEGYVGAGLGSGASADGRRKGQPFPSDFSPAPVPQDLPPISQEVQDSPREYRPVYDVLRSWNQGPINHKISNAAPVDVNVREDFPVEAVAELVRRYATGEVGSNLITVTCADPETYEAATREPERYELVRVRQGGWSEFFAAMFPEHQKQHARRPWVVPQAPPQD